MKFKSEVEITKPLDDLVVLIQDPEVTLKWLDGLRSVKHVSGEERQAGAVSKVVFDSPAGRIFINETVICNELPDEYIMRYEGKGYTSYSNYSFEKLTDQSTKFIMQQEVELKGALKLASGLLKGTMSKQLNKSAESFKRYAENQ
ncbi:MAG: carbon monoxide dehydrogenase subunit G [Bacteroidia bacterium]|jgi:carbon monoxide dehydrogenase subunit G